MTATPNGGEAALAEYRAALAGAILAYRDGDARAPDPFTYDGWLKMCCAAIEGAADRGIDLDTACEIWIDDWCAYPPVVDAGRHDVEACRAKWDAEAPSAGRHRCTAASLFMWLRPGHPGRPGAAPPGDRPVSGGPAGGPRPGVPPPDGLNDDQRARAAEAGSGRLGEDEMLRAVFEAVGRVREGAPDKPRLSPGVAAALLSPRIGSDDALPARAALLARLAADEAVKGPPDVAPYADEWRHAGVRPLARVENTVPDRVVWLEPPGDADEEASSPICSVGEPCVFSGPGGSGKSFVALALAVAAAGCEEDDGGLQQGPSAPAVGLRVRGGPVVFWSYEDEPGRVRKRVSTMADHCAGLLRDSRSGASFAAPPGDSAAGVAPEPDWRAAWRKRVLLRLAVPVPSPAPLFQPDQRGRGVVRATGFQALVDVLSGLRPSLAILDAATGIVGGADMNSSFVVASVLRDLALLSEETGTGIVVLAHDTKAGRAAVAGGGLPGAQAISGSAQWYDRARACLYLWSARVRRADDGEDAPPDLRRILLLSKCNHGPAGAGHELVPAAPPLKPWCGLRAADDGYLGDAASEIEALERELKQAAAAVDSGAPRPRSGSRCDALAVSSGERCRASAAFFFGEGAGRYGVCRSHAKQQAMNDGLDDPSEISGYTGPFAPGRGPAASGSGPPPGAGYGNHNGSGDHRSYDDMEGL